MNGEKDARGKEDDWDKVAWIGIVCPVCLIQGIGPGDWFTVVAVIFRGL